MDKVNWKHVILGAFAGAIWVYCTLVLMFLLF